MLEKLKEFELIWILRVSKNIYIGISVSTWNKESSFGASGVNNCSPYVVKLKINVQITYWKHLWQCYKKNCFMIDRHNKVRDIGWTEFGNED